MQFVAKEFHVFVIFGASLVEVNFLDDNSLTAFTLTAY